jgi:hypothetical protein
VPLGLRDTSINLGNMLMVDPVNATVFGTHFCSIMLLWFLAACVMCSVFRHLMSIVMLLIWIVVIRVFIRFF